MATLTLEINISLSKVEVFSNTEQVEYSFTVCNVPALRVTHVELTCA